MLELFLRLPVSLAESLYLFVGPLGKLLLEFLESLLVKLLYLLVFELAYHAVFAGQGVVYNLYQQESLTGTEVKIKIELEIQVNGLLEAVRVFLLQVIGKLLKGFQKGAYIEVVQTEGFAD